MVQYLYLYEVIDPFHVCGNAGNLEDKTKEIFASVKQLICTPDWVHSHRRARGLFAKAWAITANVLVQGVFFLQCYKSAQYKNTSKHRVVLEGTHKRS